MSTRLQVLLDDDELARLRQVAADQGMTLSGWVRHVLRRAARELPARRAELKLSAIADAVLHEFPAAEIDDMLAEIAQGYGELPST